MKKKNENEQRAKKERKKERKKEWEAEGRSSVISAPRPPTLRHRWSPRGRGGRGSSTGSGGTANTTPVGRLGGETDDGVWWGLDRCSSCLFAVRNNNKDKQAQTTINSTMKLSKSQLFTHNYRYSIDTTWSSLLSIPLCLSSSISSFSSSVFPSSLSPLSSAHRQWRPSTAAWTPWSPAACWACVSRSVPTRAGTAWRAHSRAVCVCDVIGAMMWWCDGVMAWWWVWWWCDSVMMILLW